MIAPIDFNIDEDKEFEFYEELLKLYNEKHAFFSTINLDENLMELTLSAINSTDNRAVEAFANVRKYMLKQRSKKKMYKLIAKESDTDFYNDPQMKNIVSISNYHFLRDPFIGKGNSLEFKFLLVSLSRFFSVFSNGLAQGIGDSISESINKFLIKVSIVEQLSPLFSTEFNEKEALGVLESHSFYSYNDGFRLVEIDKDANSFDYYVPTEDAIIHSVVNEKGFFSDYYMPEKNIEELMLEDLKKVQSVYIPGEIIDLIKTYRENDEWKEKIDIDKVEVIDHLTKNDKQETSDSIESAGNELFKQYEEFILPLIKPDQKKEDEIYYRNLIISNIFNSLQEEYSKLGVSDHLLKNITGMFCANLGLLKSEDEHLDGPSYISYTNYLRKTVENVLNKVAFLNS